jgi:hypothetical protein
MRDGVGAAIPALIPHPARRDPPPLSEFVGGQNFKERPPRRLVLCSELCSSGFHAFPINGFQCMAVLKTAVSLPPNSLVSARRILNPPQLGRDFKAKGITDVINQLATLVF